MMMMMMTKQYRIEYDFTYINTHTHTHSTRHVIAVIIPIFSIHNPYIDEGLVVVVVVVARVGGLCSGSGGVRAAGVFVCCPVREAFTYHMVGRRREVGEASRQAGREARRQGGRQASSA